MKKNVLITGASGDIGGAIARKFAKEGVNLTLQYRNEAKVDAIIETLKDYDVEIQKVKADIVHYEECERLVKETLDKYGKIDILVNNAGMIRDASTVKMTEENFKAVIDLNLTAVFYMTKLVGTEMLKVESGKIVSIASVSGIMGTFGQVNYVASKAAVMGMTKTWAREFGRKGINVNAVAPGFIVSGMTKGLEDMYTNQIPMKRFGTVDEIANGIYFLCSEEANYIQGQTLVIDGGLTL
ncbi:3-oxoacyl-ACP reductase FabG [Peptoniphilus raoultii]|uniref:3-oxoacyl-ACP reductase FabG n=1 Tax=Peptoniphilus raoultii TaxID=1776387 RepID=UPI0008DAF4AC|nr:3-oxoacyl-ACP reductase FabG [Peptoniphilus raoultii]